MCKSICCDLNFLAILVSSLGYFALGSLWYSPVMFGSAWLKLVNINMKKPDKNEMIRLFGTTFILIVISAIVMDYFILMFGVKDLIGGAWIGFLAAIGFVATTIGVTFMYEGKPLKLFLIDTGYHFAGFLILGAILGVWN
jgi:hypothetical protein